MNAKPKIKKIIIFHSAYQFGSDGEAVGEAVFDDGDGFKSTIDGLLAGVFGEVE